MPVENLLTPDYLRRIAWRPPTPATAGSIAEALEDLGARKWQRELAVPVITEAFLHPEPLAERKPKADEVDPNTGSRKR